MQVLGLSPLLTASITCTSSIGLGAIATLNTEWRFGSWNHWVSCPWLALSCSTWWCSARPWLSCASLQGGSFVRLPPCAALKQEPLAYIWPSISLVTEGLGQTALENVLLQMTEMFIARGDRECCYCPLISAVNIKKISAWWWWSSVLQSSSSWS